MDYKQKKIFKNICDKYNLKGNKIVLVQHRNLKEFRHFIIERINPNHKIKLYGLFKKKYVKSGCNNRIINVGEIIISIGILLFPSNQFILDLLISIAFYIFLNNLFIDNEILKVKINVDRNRGFTKFWKNSSCDTLY